MWFVRGITGVIERVQINRSDTGLPMTGLTSASASLVIAIIADNEATSTAYSGANIETIAALGTYAAPTSGKVRFKEVDATNHPGLYEIQAANARYAVASSRYVDITVSGVASMLAVTKRSYLQASNPDDTVRMGMTALPNAAANAIGGLAGSVLEAGTAQGGAVASITLRSGASSSDDVYNNKIVMLVSGTGAPDSRLITDYAGSTRIATVDRNWATNPDSTTVYAILPLEVFGLTPTEVAEAVWNAVAADYNVALSLGEKLNAAGSSADPLQNTVASYSAGQLGFILGTNLDVVVSSRLAGGDVPTNFSIMAIDADGAVDSDVQKWSGTAVATPDTAGYPKVTMKSGTGIGEINLSGGNLAGSVASVTGAVGSVTGNVGGNVVGSVASVTADVTLAASAVDAVWDEPLAGHTTAGTTGLALSTASAAADPWGTALPGAYSSGTAGYILGTNLNALMTSRAAAGDAMDLVSDAVDANSLATAAITEIVDAVFARTFNSAFSNLTFDQLVKVISAVLAGRISGVGTGTISISNLADTGTVIQSTYDGDNNRVSVTITI
jgi:hypothetical protein